LPLADVVEVQLHDPVPSTPLALWDQIFKDPMTITAAIDRLVHHATILEFTGESIRANAAKKRQS